MFSMMWLMMMPIAPPASCAQRKITDREKPGEVTSGVATSNCPLKYPVAEVMSEPLGSMKAAAVWVVAKHIAIGPPCHDVKTLSAKDVPHQAGSAAASEIPAAASG